MAITEDSTGNTYEKTLRGTVTKIEERAVEILNGECILSRSAFEKGIEQTPGATIEDRTDKDKARIRENAQKIAREGFRPKMVMIDKSRAEKQAAIAGKGLVILEWVIFLNMNASVWIINLSHYLPVSHHPSVQTLQRLFSTSAASSINRASS